MCQFPNLLSSYSSYHPKTHLQNKTSVTTTLIRVVYECSCRQSQEHPSLNDILLPGPPIANDLTATLSYASSAWVTSVTLTAPSEFTAPRLSPAICHRQPTGLSAPFPGSPALKPASCGFCAIPERRTRPDYTRTGSRPERMDQESSASELPQGDLQHALQIYA